MKSLSIFVSAAALLSASSVFALDCATLPSCASLGYNDTVAHCPKSVNGEDLAVKCPFDTTQGKCMYEAAVGQIGYFTKAPNANSGWLLCDGRTITETQYPDLYKFLGQQFCTTDHGGTCGEKVGRVPDYRGYFLRVYAQGNSTTYASSTFATNSKTFNNSFTVPQKEGLPNITGETHFSDTWRYRNTDSDSYHKFTGPFVKKYGKGWADGRGDNLTGIANLQDGILYLGFDASKSNSIYGSSTGVTPPNYAVYAYIYAGKVVK